MNKPVFYFTKKLKECREKQEMTQEDFANFLSLNLGKNVSRSLVGKWEVGNRPVRAKTVLAIAKILKINDVSTLVERK